MLNLLTERAKKNVAREYHLRLAAVACFFAVMEISFAALGGAFSFNALRNESTQLLQDTSILQKERDSAAEARIKEVAVLKSRLALLHSSIPPYPSEAISLIASLRHSGVRISSFVLSPAEKDEWMLTVTGIAATRDALAAFERALKDDRHFESVAVPVGNFAKGTDLQFTATAAYRGTL